ncbi:hypothetical protein G3576_22860 [Roseomonas stagni]|uniref:DUF3325 domain-containing protein n=1 Tax=Falsiroseomonas algicola TaxID=2716930 RepID=A0A6M1LS54_9PROT|nr:hypothetical protein [Falsiroseomonas algicola]NGM22872.1 hypothetical protein [Falsiroseomonas algicola]
MLILAFGFLALAAALEYRAREAQLLRMDPRSDRAWRILATICGVVAGIGPLVVMARIGVGQGAGAYAAGAAFAFAGAFTPHRLWPMISPAAGVFGLGLLVGALFR